MKTFFETSDGEWFTGTDATRGPWHPDHCHAGPVTGMLARALENLLPGKQLVRLSAVFSRPVPLAGFRIDAEIARDGRVAATAAAALQDAEGRVCATAASLHLAARDQGELPTTRIDGPVFSDAQQGDFPIDEARHELPMFAHAVEIAYPPGETGRPGPTTLWMRAPPLLPDEQPSPFQRLCPLGDCGNALSRNAELDEVAFLNPDLTIVCFRAPQSQWLASSSTSFWEPTGIGLANAMLFDEAGPVATAQQTLVLSRD